MISESKTFRQIRNDEKDIEAIADGYKSKIIHELWLVEGLQKDAIQNSWDAKIDKHGKGWECNFSIKQFGNKKYLCITDTGTHGLNGTLFNTEEELVEILHSGERKEDLACFLNSNWSAKTAEEGGNRGRGKTLFLIASQDKKILFESIRSDDSTYVFGEVYLDTDKQIKFQLYYNEEGKQRICEVIDKGFVHLHQQGTRILILNPLPEIETAIKNGEMLLFISNSRWEIIKKYQTKISIDDGQERKYAILPHWYEDLLDNVPSKVFDKPEIIKEGTDYRVKKIVLRYPTDLPDHIKGIAIQRGGMTIQRLPADELVHEEGMGNIYGWVELDKKLEEGIKNCEGPEHLGFSWNTKPAKYLKDHLRSKVREFAKELKIIESDIAKRNKIQKEAEARALKSLSPLFKRLGLSGKHKGKRSRQQHHRRENEPLRLSIADIKFPRENRRVNYEETIQDTYVIPINEFSDSLLVLVKLWIVIEGKNHFVEEKEFNLHPGIGSKIGPELIKISRDYKKGGYSLRAKMVSLEKIDRTLPDGTKIEKGTILYDRINQKFYVETDPPESGPFHFQPKGKEDKEYLLDWEEEDDGYIIYYNILHPRIKPIETDFDKLSDYLTEQGAMMAFQIKLEDLIAEEDDSDKDFNTLIKSKDIIKVMPTIFKKHSEFLWDYKK